MVVAWRVLCPLTEVTTPERFVEFMQQPALNKYFYPLYVFDSNAEKVLWVVPCAEEFTFDHLPDHFTEVAEDRPIAEVWRDCAGSYCMGGPQGGSIQIEMRPTYRFSLTLEIEEGITVELAYLVSLLKHCATLFNPVHIAIRKTKCGNDETESIFSGQRVLFLSPPTYRTIPLFVAGVTYFSNVLVDMIGRERFGQLESLSIGTVTNLDNGILVQIPEDFDSEEEAFNRKLTQIRTTLELDKLPGI